MLPGIQRWDTVWEELPIELRKFHEYGKKHITKLTLDQNQSHDSNHLY